MATHPLLPPGRSESDRRVEASSQNRPLVRRPTARPAGQVPQLRSMWSLGPHDGRTSSGCPPPVGVQEGQPCPGALRPCSAQPSIHGPMARIKSIREAMGPVCPPVVSARSGNDENGSPPKGRCRLATSRPGRLAIAPPIECPRSSSRPRAPVLPASPPSGERQACHCAQ